MKIAKLVWAQWSATSD